MNESQPPQSVSATAELLAHRTITLKAGLRVAAAATAHANAIAVPACIAVSDPAGHLVTFCRMDGAPLMSMRIAQDKAYSVVAFKGMPTHEWWALLENEPALLHGIVKTERLMIFGGGLPIRVGDELVGAIGVSGGSSAQDVEIAEAGVRALSDEASG
jgi:glc operon protein GlcG